MAEEHDHYATLGVSPQADEREIRLAFRRQARLYHPDVAGTGDLGRMLQVNEAYRVLSDPERRRIYDRMCSESMLRPAREAAAPTGATVHTTSTASGAAAFEQAERGAASAKPAPGTVRHSPGPLRQLTRLATHDRTPLASLSLARGGNLLATGLQDGRVRLWDVPGGRESQTLLFGIGGGAAGVLHAVRLSPAGSLAVAWGFELGTRVWSVADGRALWTSGANAPSGAMDVTVADEPALARLALPDAPLALSGDDPFRWATEGRAGTAIFSRPLAGPVEPSWAVPRHCVEGRASNGGNGGSNSNNGWRVHDRLLSADGMRLLTFLAQPAPGKVRTMALHVWELDGRALLNGGAPRRVARVALAPGAAGYPLATTPDLSWVAVGYQEQTVRVVAPTSQTVRTLTTDLVPPEARMALSADAALLALARGRVLDVWAVADGTHVQRWEFGAEVSALVFAERTARASWPALVVGLANGVAEIWG